MTTTVYRYPLKLEDEQVIEMPAGAEILHVARRENHRVMLGVAGVHDAIELWARVDPDQPVQPRHIRVAGTGHLLGDDELVHLGTVQTAEGRLVFHIFERPVLDVQAVAPRSNPAEIGS